LDILHLGGGGIRISGRLLSLVIDPPAELAKLAADVVLLSSPDVPRPTTDLMIIDAPGEYEIKESTILAVPSPLHVDESGTRGTTYLVEVDGLKIGFLGNVASPLRGEVIELLSGVDVLVVPVGGHGLTLDPADAAVAVSQVDPKYVVPIHYDDGVSKYPMPQEKLDKFLSEVGSTPEPQSKLKLTGRDMPTETTVVVLTQQQG
jgi:L-ascorbate metabolism protein UlaG (beta-lactamase superfamily)